MKIAIVIYKYNSYGGYERQAFLLSKWLVKENHEVTVVSSTWIAEPSIKFIRVPVITLFSWLKVLSFVVNTRKIILYENLDLVIAFDRTLMSDVYRAGNACHRAWIDYRKKNGTLKDRISIAINPLHMVINWIEKRIFSLNQSDRKIIVLSDLGMDQIQKYYKVDSARFQVLPPLLDNSRMNYDNMDELRLVNRDKHNLKTKIVLLHVGSGFRIKGLAASITAVSILKDAGYNVCLLVVGKDSKGTKVFGRVVKNLKVEDEVRFVGGIDDIETYYAVSDIFLLPSKFETFGISAIEALYCGLPVVVSDGAGVSTFINNESLGLVVSNTDDGSELSDAIKYIIDNQLTIKHKLEKHNFALTFCDQSKMKYYLYDNYGCQAENINSIIK